jgi:REP element-mobilizing transposase RayT
MGTNMKYDPEKHHRRSIRLQGYDYAKPGGYFITVVAHRRECLFGEIADARMQLNAAGQMVEKWWLELEHKFPAVSTGTYVVMPNHFHGVIVINDVPVGADLRVGPGVSKEDGAHVETEGAHAEDRGAHVGAPLPVIVQWFKTMTTNEYIRGVKQLGWPAFDGKLWQRNYYEHIIRNDDDANRIHQYIESNPAGWAGDGENPATQ